jgi:hypothetical protein
LFAEETVRENLLHTEDMGSYIKMAKRCKCCGKSLEKGYSPLSDLCNSCRIYNSELKASLYYYKKRYIKLKNILAKYRMGEKYK